MDRPPVGISQRKNISDIAALSGFSKGSVSKAINNRPGISEETRRHILGVAAAAGWRPAAGAVAMASQRSRTIGVILNRAPDLLASDPYFAELLSGVELVLAKHGYWLLIQIVEYRDQDEEMRAYRDLAESNRVDGVLISETRVEDFRLPLVKALGLPAVIVSKPWSEVDLPWEGPSSPGGGMDEAIRYLVDRGRDRIAYVSGPPNRSYVMFRTHTLVEAIGEQGASLVGIRPTDTSAEEGFAATDALMRQINRPNAIVYDNDQMALAGCRAIESHGLKIPDDVAIIGHDDLSVAKWFSPALTTVSQDIEGLGMRCATRLLTILGEIVDELEPFGDPRLVVRESAG
jgi:DNA-binding LacI/PurR family transcriptional regulator